ncbi:vacuolar atp synthase subunit ac39 [Anaeramoeba flamelloides]|uniref:Vacuolar atp synthase subunit ac39 n=1 Tax=Anaeramoeba flamelloides TaxID=1746091 RepID=A0ABQ8YP56_9EUKA|nr:vacuolar atp synthase subunit ac39 [Anaeramoeba flamelloides]
MLSFNIENGYYEAVVRGYRKSLLTSTDYGNLIQCETLDDVKLHLTGTTYGQFLANEPTPLDTTVIAEKCTEKLVEEFNYIHKQVVDPLSTFLDYITYGYMIDNIVYLISGTIHNSDLKELLKNCHPLGMFEEIEALSVSTNPSDLYDSVIVDLPLAPYFVDCLSKEDLNELNIEIILNTLYKAYLEDFYKYCEKIGGTTFEVMSELLKFEADRRTITITVNSFGTELRKDDKLKLFPTIGYLYPDGNNALAKAEDEDGVRAALENYNQYNKLFEETELDGEKSLEDFFFEMEVELNKASFERQFHYGVFYSFVKLKEQEIRNIVRISESKIEIIDWPSESPSSSSDDDDDKFSDYVLSSPFSEDEDFMCTSNTKKLRSITQQENNANNDIIVLDPEIESNTSKKRKLNTRNELRISKFKKQATKNQESETESEIEKMDNDNIIIEEEKKKQKEIGKGERKEKNKKKKKENEKEKENKKKSKKKNKSKRKHKTRKERNSRKRNDKTKKKLKKKSHKKKKSTSKHKQNLDDINPLSVINELFNDLDKNLETSNDIKHQILLEKENLKFKRQQKFLKKSQKTASINFKPPTCTICLELVNIEGVSTPCGHVFHRGCISEWLKHQKKCPNCKVAVKPKNLRQIKFCSQNN